jgi:hypothetical protein
VAPTAFLVNPGEQLHHVADGVDVSATDVAASQHLAAAAAAALDHLGPPGASRENQSGDGEDRGAQNAPAFDVHVAPSEIIEAFRVTAVDVR